jgi:hypothetical protein
MAGARVVFLAPGGSLYQGFFALLIVFAESLRSFLYVLNISPVVSAFLFVRMTKMWTDHTNVVLGCAVRPTQVVL